ncbi:hypothetical protein TruAng_008737 [Truncatella angustata]|nr:hypothetical protein TruAng_008737 [Truncatella angustata]
MVYTDDKGVRHSIYMPKGTMQLACDHYENKRWDELAKFDKYTNQGYTEDDFELHEQEDSKKDEETGETK